MTDLFASLRAEHPGRFASPEDENDHLRADLADAQRALAIADEMASSHTNIMKAAG